jgi:2-oxoisovalerate dehydrogenase E1 component alpha subunit
MLGSETDFDTTEVLDPSGRLIRPLPDLLATRDKLVHLYQIMVQTRVFDRAAINLQRTGAMGTYPPGEGQEAIGAGVGFAMRKEDVLVPNYRDIATQIQRGVLLQEILRYWGGDEWGMHFSNQSQDFPMSLPIASQSCHAVGIAYAIKYRQQARAVVTTCGDGATSEGDFYESINVAGAMRLPVVFVVVNNGWAISVPLEKQTASATIAHKALAVGINGYRVDGNDVIAVTQVMSEALELARNNNQPCIVEAISYRLGDHTTADDASRYRDPEECEAAKKLEPLIRFKAYLQNELEWSDSEDEATYAHCNDQVKTAIEAYKAFPAQAAGEFFDYMFAKPTMDLQKQKREWLDEHKRHG